MGVFISSVRVVYLVWGEWCCVYDVCSMIALCGRVRACAPDACVRGPWAVRNELCSSRLRRPLGFLVR